MSRRVIIARNPLEPNDWAIHEDVAHVRAFLMEQFPTWPDGARIYHNEVAQTHDVTPFDEASVARLDELDGDLYVVVYPEGVVAVLLLVVVAVVAAVAVVALAKPKVPEVAATAEARNLQQSSPNNELAQRSNKPRINGRIPDIYGTVRSTPDLIAQPYRIYQNNQEVEIAYMCIGRGEYAIYDAKDGDTHLAYIAGAAAEFYGPNTSPNNSAPFFSYGAPIAEPVRRAKRAEQVVGQELRAPNAASANSPGNFKFQYPNRIYNSVGFNFADLFQPGDQIYVYGGEYSGFTVPVSTNQIARYVYNGGNRYIEWQASDPRTFFQAGDTIFVIGATYTQLKKPFTTSWTGQARFRSNGRIYFDAPGQDHPAEAGANDFRLNKDFALTNATLNYNFSGTYTVQSKTTTTITLANPTAVTDDWNFVNGQTWGFRTFSVRGISSSYRVEEGGVIRLAAGNFNDVNVGDTVVLSGATYSTSLSGTYQATSFSDGQDYWQLNDPSSVTAEWNEVKDYTRYAIVTIQQTHSTDTINLSFDAPHYVSSVTDSRIYVTPTGPSSGWDNITNVVNERTEYTGGTDQFNAPTPYRYVNLTGYYTIAAVGLYELTLSNPQGTTLDWNRLQFFSNMEAIPANSTIAATGGNWIGPFFLDVPDMTHVHMNFIADGGLYKDNGQQQYRAQVELQMLFYPANEYGGGVGGYQEAFVTLSGSAVNRDTIAVTRTVGLTTPGRQLVYCRRVTALDKNFEGQVVDTVKWKEVWMMSPEPRAHFGDVTTVMTKTYATGGALAVKDRRLNCLVTRRIQAIQTWSGTAPNYTPVYYPDKVATNHAAQIFCAIARDPMLGNRAESEIDFYGIFQALNEVYTYFGSNYLATEFCYTFDNTSISFEEMAQAIANAVFCVAYRQGEKIKWKPEVATSDSVLIFNHRNKIPGTETRTVRFSSHNDHDSIRMEWVNPIDDGIETFFIPEDQSGVRTKSIETIGIRNRTQATWHAWRSYYKTLYSNVAVEFEATQEAALLIQRDRVLVADNTRAETQDGEVVDQEVLQLTLSQEVDLDPAKTYTIFLQHYDATVEAIPITSVPDNLDVNRNGYFRPDGSFRFQTAAQAGLLSPGNVVTIANASFTDPVNGVVNLNNAGYIVESVDGSTGVVTFSNALEIDTDWLKISGSESTLRLNVKFISERYSKRKVNLQYAPAAPLSLDPANYARATYMIRSNVETAPAAFMVQETRPRDNFTYQVSLVNYDPRFYYMDDLKFWMNFDDQTFKDASAQARHVDIGTSASKATITYDSTRKSYTYYNPTNASAARITSNNLTSHGGSYTKAVWVRQSGGFDAYFLSNSNEQFRVNNNNRIIAGHAPNVAALTWVGFPSSDGNWHHIACTYDASTQILRLYLDGIIRAQRTGVAAPAAAGLQPIGIGNVGVIGPRCDDLRYWQRAFSSQEIAELYNATR